MKTSLPRLRSVTMKATGQRIDVLRRSFDAPDTAFMRHAHMVARMYPDGIAGHAIVVWNETGGWSACYRPGGPVPDALVASFAHDCLLRRTVDGDLERQGLIAPPPSTDRPA